MGLDMYLYGEKHVSYAFDEDPVKEDGFVLESKTLSIGYWRKHANLHGYIVDAFADGKDECQRIELYEDELAKIIEALETDSIYEERVEGFFFGKSYFPGEKDEYGSYEEQKEEDLKIFRGALGWVKIRDPNKKYDFRTVYYQSSW